MGHEVAVAAIWGLQGARTGWNGITVYPCGLHPFSSDVIGGHAKHFGADLTFTLLDPFAQDVALLRGQNLAMWTPVDREPLGELDQAALSGTTARVIAMSRFGKRVLDSGGHGALYCPHGIDTTVFRRMGNRAAIRRALGLPQDKFVIGINACNKDTNRKGFPEQFAAFAGLHAKYPDTMLLCHTLSSTVSGGDDLRALAANLGIDEAVGWADAYAYVAGSYTAADMAAWYNALDLYSGATWGEGFGLPVIEAQACGIPTVVTDCSAMSELAGPGWKVAGEPYWVGPFHAWWTKPYVGHLAAAYEDAYRAWKDGTLERTYSAECREFALQYDADVVAGQYMEPVLADLEEGLGDAADGIIRYGGFRWQIGGTEPSGDGLALGHEALIDQTVLRLLPSGGVFLDVGAHVGHYTVRASAKASKVIAVEVSPETVQQLERNLELNSITCATVHNVAAWDDFTMLTLHSPNGFARDGSNMVRDTGGPDGRKVPGVPLDAVLKDEPRVDLVKLDVEGADLHALRGMRETLDRCRPVLFIEDHSVYGFYDREDLDGLLAELGYTFRDLPVYKGYVIARPEGFNAHTAAAAAMAHGASQCLDELTEVLTLLHRTRPQVVAEIGCDQGGTLYAWRQICAEVYGITLADNSYETGGTGAKLAAHGAVVHVGDSHDLSSRDWLAAKLEGRSLDVLVVDGDHRVAGVRQDLAMYGPLVRPGGLILVHDIASEGDDRAEVWRLWPELVARFDTSEIVSGEAQRFGWGVIRVRDGDLFGGAAASAAATWDARE